MTEPAIDTEHRAPAPSRPPLETLLSRALHLRCPRCGEGRLFINWFTMPERCSVCHLKFERAPGYFLGSAYLNYGATAVLVMSLYFVLHFGWRWSNKDLAGPLALVCTLFPLWAFRYARSVWLALDCHFDKGVLSGDETS